MGLLDTWKATKDSAAATASAAALKVRQISTHTAFETAQTALFNAGDTTALYPVLDAIAALYNAGATAEADAMKARVRALLVATPAVAAADADVPAWITARLK